MIVANWYVLQNGMLGLSVDYNSTVILTSSEVNLVVPGLQVSLLTKKQTMMRLPSQWKTKIKDYHVV